MTHELATTESPIVPYWRVLGWEPRRWDQFVDEERRRREKLLPPAGPHEIARQWGLKVAEVGHLWLEAGFVRGMPERQEALLDMFTTASEIAISCAVEKLSDVNEVKDTKIKDLVTIARQSSDGALNLKNGSAAPTMNISVQDAKILVQLNKQFQEPFEPVAIPPCESSEGP